MRTFSSTVSVGKMFVSWNERPMPRRARAAAPRRVTSSPLNQTRPAVGRYWPESRLKSVVLPAPFGPMIDLSVQGAMSRDTRSTAACPPNRIVRSRVETIGTVIAGPPGRGPPG